MQPSKREHISYFVKKKKKKGVSDHMDMGGRKSFEAI